MINSAVFKDVLLSKYTKDGYIYEVISGGPDGTGFGQMGPYKDISVEDRWKIVAYIRALTHKDEQ